MSKHTSSIVKVSIGLVACAFLGCAPTGAADPPLMCDDQAPEQQQQCQDQPDAGAGIAQQVIDNANQGLNQANQGLNQANQANQGLNGPTDGKHGEGLHLLLDGVPTCVPVGQPISSLVHQEADPAWPAHGRCTY